METYRWRFYYSGIFMVWCVGYLEKTKLMSFLRTAKTRLTPSAVRMSRRSEPDSFIIVFDNVLNPLEKPLMHKRQIPRTKADLESIFREEETGEQIAIAALVQRPVLLSRGQVGVSAALLRWAMLPQLPGKTR